MQSQGEPILKFWAHYVHQRRGHGPIAFATSIISAQPLIMYLLGKDEAEDLISLPEPLHDSISARHGEPVDTESLIGVTQKMARLNSLQ